ncbi:MAG TPA: FAD-dependent oxidoreductase [Woeseiaceae bacterium]
MHTVSRRKVIAALAALPIVSACASRGTAVANRHFTPSGLPLRRVNVAADRVIRTDVGLRPYRDAGFVLRTDRLDDKLLIHNYGHGGGGITLSWGTAHMAMETALASEHRRCAVIGCGAVGLASARLMQQQGWQVTIYARDLPPDTTSNIAGAQWSPASVFDCNLVSPAFYDQLEHALQLSYRHFQPLVGERYGVRWVSNYMLNDRPFREDDLHGRFAHLYPELRDLGTDEHPFPAAYARHFNTMFIEPPVYLPAVMRDFFAAGGEIVVREFGTPAELSTLVEPVIFNCTGLGSRELFGDHELIPAKGQLVVLLPEEGINYLMIYSGIYMFPRKDGVLLGGTFERNDWSLAPDTVAATRIVQEHQAFFSKMADPFRDDGYPS